MTTEVPAFLWALLAQAAIGGTDVILNHEMIAQLPRQPNAGAEQRCHAMREALFALIFPALAWWEWHGAWLAVIVLLFALEIWVSTIDTIIEWETRRLPWTERVEHVALFINYGIIVALLGARALDWAHAPTELVRVDYGWPSWVLTMLAVVSLAWAIRDTRNVIQRGRVRPA